MTLEIYRAQIGPTCVGVNRALAPSRTTPMNWPHVRGGEPKKAGYRATENGQ